MNRERERERRQWAWNREGLLGTEWNEYFSSIFFLLSPQLQYSETPAHTVYTNTVQIRPCYPVDQVVQAFGQKKRKDLKIHFKWQMYHFVPTLLLFSQRNKFYKCWDSGHNPAGIPETLICAQKLNKFINNHSCTAEIANPPNVRLREKEEKSPPLSTTWPWGKMLCACDTACIIPWTRVDDTWGFNPGTCTYRQLFLPSFAEEKTPRDSTFLDAWYLIINDWIVQHFFSLSPPKTLKQLRISWKFNPRCGGKQSLTLCLC